MAGLLPKVTPARRRQLAWRRHHLRRAVTGSGAVARVAGDLLALHATDPASVFLALWARVRGFTTEALDAALYEERLLLRLLAMRRTLFVVPVVDLADLHASSTLPLAAPQRKVTLNCLREGGVEGDLEAWLDAVEEAAAAALAARGEARLEELAEDVPELGRKLAVGRETRWPATISVGSRVLAGLAIRGTAVRTRPVGTWRSSRHLWGFLPAWLGVPAPAADPPTAHRRRARAALAGRYVARFGPVTEEDVAWWTGWGLGDTRMALADAAVERVMVDGPAGAAEAYVAAADLEEATAQRGVDPGDRVVLLPALDSTIMGWKGRDWYLGELAPRLFDRNGNAGATIWHRGRVIGGWAQRADGHIAVELLVDRGKGVAARARREADRLEAWLADQRFVPRFPSPLDRALRR